MPVFVSEFLAQLKGIWSQLTSGQRLTVSAVLAATLVGLGALIWVGTRPEWIALGSYEDRDDRAVAIRTLEDAGVRFRVQDGAIEIDSADSSKARAALAKKKMPSAEGGSSGVLGLGADRRARRWKLQLARISRIERQLRRLDGVHGAILNVFDPEPSLFERRNVKRPPSASVVVSLGDPSEFARVAKRVNGIVAKGLGMARSDVEVFSEDHRSWRYGDEGGGDSGAYGQLLDLQARYSSMLSRKVRLYLQQIYPGKTRVAVHVEYENKVIQRQKRILAEDKIVKEEQSFNETDQGASAAGGDPNRLGSVGGNTASPTGPSGGGSKSTRKHSKKTYEPFVGDESYKALAPDLKRVSVSLSIDKSIESNRAAIEEQVKLAVGWDAQRDPPLGAMVAEFPAESEELDTGGGVMNMVSEYAPIAGQILSVLLVLLFLRGLLKKARTPAPTAATAGIADAEEEDPVQRAKRMRRDIEKAVAQDPASVSRLLEVWLSDKQEAS